MVVLLLVAMRLSKPSTFNPYLTRHMNLLSQTATSYYCRKCFDKILEPYQKTVGCFHPSWDKILNALFDFNTENLLWSTHSCTLAFSGGVVRFKIGHGVSRIEKSLSKDNLKTLSPMLECFSSVDGPLKVKKAISELVGKAKVMVAELRIRLNVSDPHTFLTFRQFVAEPSKINQLTNDLRWRLASAHVRKIGHEIRACRVLATFPIIEIAWPDQVRHANHSVVHLRRMIHPETGAYKTYTYVLSAWATKDPTFQFPHDWMEVLKSAVNSVAEQYLDTLKAFKARF